MKTSRNVLAALSLTAVLAACGSSDGGAENAASRTQSGSDAYGWHHISLLATDGTSIKIDYQVGASGSWGYGSPTYYDANPIWISLERPGFAGGHANVVVMDSTAKVLMTQDLARVNDNKFSAQLSRGLELGSSDHRNARFQIAVVVDGQWLKDPISGNNNFTFELSN